jgi:CheY-like chemotaxis protein/HPt (histidine-containing phosphotransfer) domain-containing protein
MKQLDEDTQSTVKQLNASAKMLLALLNDILDFSKLDAKKLELEQQPIEVAAFIHSLLDTHQAKADKKQLQLQLRHIDCEDYYLGDQLRLGQILNNLLDNAIKFTDAGTVSLSVSQADRDDQSWLKFTIEDNGVGISEDKLNTIFTPFVQADTAVTRKFGGTGLGLTICAKLIQLMQGHYGVDSTPGKGSCFWFEIPMPHYASVSDEKEDVVAQQAEWTLQGKSILLVEDNEINQAVAAGMLENLGCQIDIASAGQQAVTLCQQQAYDLILMDYHMPEMDGLEATALIRQQLPDNKNQTTPIIALTADVQHQVQTKFRHAGANDLLVKPFTFKRLTELLSQWLSKSADELRSEQEDSAQHSIIDDAVFEDIEVMSGAQADSLIRNIIDLYLQKTPVLLDEIHHGVQEGDSEKLFKAAHALKSSSANVGAMKVSAIAKKLEKMAREGLLEQAKQEIEHLLDSYMQAELCLKGRLGEAS